MKWSVGIVVFGITSMLGAIDQALSKGAMIEGQFILKNKHVAVKEVIQSLKKELSQDNAVDKVAEKPLLDAYHAKLKQLLYPTYIDDLSSIVALLEKDLAMIQNEVQPPSKTSFEEMVQRGFLAGEKIDAERKLLLKIFEVDRQEQELAALRQAPDTYRREEGRRTVSKLAASIAHGKEDVEGLKVQILEINKALYSGDLKQQVHLERLMFRRR